jgi:hypothetical protein
MPENTQEQLAEELRNEPGLGDRPRGKWTPEMEEQVERERQRNVLAATIAGLSWGKQMTPVVRRAFAAYCARYDVDPITEMDNLGGVPYVNADWYKRKLGELIVRGIVRDYTLEHIQADARLEKMMRDPDLTPEMREVARKRWFDNTMKRIEQNAPEEAEAVCVCTIFLASGAKAIGCKWAGGGTSVKQFRHGGGKEPNPIAEANPTLSVESMSIRRALSQLVSHVTGERLVAIIPDVTGMNEELKGLQEVVVPAPEAPAAPEPLYRAIAPGGYDNDATMLADAIRKRGGTPTEVMSAPSAPVPPKHMFVGADQDPYGFDTEAELNALESVEAPSTPASRERRPAPAGAVEELAARPIPNATEFIDGEEVATGPAVGAPAPDLFGGESAVEPTGLDATECESCGRLIRRGHPDDHDAKCDGYVAP